MGLRLARALALAPVLACLAALLAAPAGAQPAREEIAQYLSRVEVHRDNSVTVTETITVDALGQRIKRGIYRDVPLGGAGLLAIGGNGFELLSTTRDGRPEPSHTERNGNVVRIYLGDAGTFLSPGTYRYTITYRMTHVVRHFDAYDEVYWNATGNDWAFDIAEARVVVVPPDGAPVEQTSVYTGGFGARGDNAATGTTDQGNPVFTTTRPLRAGEGITVAVAWPKGYVDPPSWGERIAAWLGRNGSWLAGLVTIALLVAYYAFAWMRVGRDPERGTIIPVYHPELPPAAMRYIERMGFDNICMSAALVSLAVKGRLRIEDRDGTTVLIRVNDEPEVKTPVSDGERALLEALFSGGDEVEVGRGERTRLRAATAALKRRFDAKFNKVYFNTNLLWFMGGALITAIGAVGVVLLAPASAPLVIAAAFPLVFVGVFGVAFFGMARRALTAFRARRFGAVLGLVLPVAFFVFFFVSFWGAGGSELGGLAMRMLSYGAVPIAAVAAIVVLNIVFFFLLRAPTAIGREALDEIEGTRLYMTVAETDRIRFQSPPDRTPEHFHELLPYALALGVETAWTEQFRAEIDAAQADPDHDPYLRPRWYRGRYGGGFSSVSDVGRLGPAMSTALAAATVSQSSSGSGGGGFSGGGSGGGGGGGW